MLAFCTVILAQCLCFEEAAQLALENSPELHLQEDMVGKRIGEHTQAQMRPNPLFNYSIENILGNRNWKGMRNAKERFDFTHAFETAGKRRLRTNAATYAVNEAEEQVEVTRLMLLNRLKKLFIDAAGKQALLELAEKRAANGEEIVKTLKLQVGEGKKSPRLVQKIQVELAQVLFSQERAREDLRYAKELLALEWGSPFPEFDRLCFDLDNLETPYTVENDTIARHPLLQQGEYRLKSMEEIVKYQKALAVPNFVFTAGFQTEREKHGWNFDITFPLPIFDRNQGNIVTAEFEEQSALTQLTANQTQLQTQLRNAIKNASRLFKEAIFFRDYILKAARDSYQSTLDCEREGKAGPLEILEAREALLEVEEQYVQALINTHKAQVDIDYLIPPKLMKGYP